MRRMSTEVEISSQARFPGMRAGNPLWRHRRGSAFHVPETLLASLELVDACSKEVDKVRNESSKTIARAVLALVEAYLEEEKEEGS